MNNLVVNAALEVEAYNDTQLSEWLKVKFLTCAVVKTDGSVSSSKQLLTP